MIEYAYAPGEAMESRGVVITPLFPRRDPAAQYITLDEALLAGLQVREVDKAGRVSQLVVENPLADDVLLYDGEGLIGAKQDRILNVSVLVAGESTTPIPVSCVEPGRWQRRSRRISSSGYTGHPSLRARKAASLLESPLALGLAQGDVWEEVAASAEKLGISSSTMAHFDAFRAYEAQLADLGQAFRLRRGQCGAVLVSGKDVCLDAVSRSEAFERIWPKLLRGYLFDALHRLDEPPADHDVATRFIDAVTGTVATSTASAGRGNDLRLDGATVVGSGLELDGEVLQLSAFARAAGS